MPTPPLQRTMTVDLQCCMYFESKKYTAKQIAQKSLKIAADLCIYTNDTITVMEIK